MAGSKMTIQQIVARLTEDIQTARCHQPDSGWYAATCTGGWEWDVFLARFGQVSLPEADFLFMKPQAQFGLLGFGRTVRVRADGATRFAGLRSSLRRVIQDLGFTVDARPRWLGGFSFAPGPHGAPWREWPDCEFRLPRWLVERSGERVWLTLTLTAEEASRFDLEHQLARELSRWLENDRPVQPVYLAGGPESRVIWDEDDALAKWQAAVSQTALEIQSGEYQKAVLARSVRVQGGAVKLALVIERLSAMYPEAYVFAVRQGSEWFVGATPERLVSVRERQVHIDGLAGTTSRGETEAEDRRLAAELLASAKNRQEHRAVVDWIATSIADAVAEMQIPREPQIRRLANVQHLYTPVTGYLRANMNVLDLVERLHPTPAVAGVPRTKALSVIAHREWFSRGWYAGPVGWMTLAGDGEFAVALRSGLLSASTSTLFAGAGIMGDSDADAEWTETEWKFQPMLRALEVRE
ncbi:isochorismate synthase [Alicyclobacillus herbarius]|uniref:isochorismate synthase n=1 Tax=Alicyclobacillus herbarius TaxID=122960 RepID=UPI0009D63E12|nr:isochorismate synthase [Alicyclobacillus herbarius]